MPKATAVLLALTAPGTLGLPGLGKRVHAASKGRGSRLEQTLQALDDLTIGDAERMPSWLEDRCKEKIEVAKLNAAEKSWTSNAAEKSWTSMVKACAQAKSGLATDITAAAKTMKLRCKEQFDRDEDLEYDMRKQPTNAQIVQCKAAFEWQGLYSGKPCAMYDLSRDYTRRGVPTRFRKIRYNCGDEGLASSGYQEVKPRPVKKSGGWFSWW